LTENKQLDKGHIINAYADKKQKQPHAYGFFRLRLPRVFLRQLHWRDHRADMRHTPTGALSALSVSPTLFVHSFLRTLAIKLIWTGFLGLPISTGIAVSCA